MQRNYIQLEEKLKKQYKKKKIKLHIFLTVVLFICFAICINHKTTYEEKLKEFSQKFLYIEQINENIINESNNFLEISNVQLSVSSDLPNTIDFSCSINNTSSSLGTNFNQNTSLIVFLNDGSTYEYALFSEGEFIWAGTSFKIDPVAPYRNTSLDFKYNLTNISSPTDIKYIKLHNITIWDSTNANRDISNSCDLKLYSNN